MGKSITFLEVIRRVRLHPIGSILLWLQYVTVVACGQSGTVLAIVPRLTCDNGTDEPLPGLRPRLGRQLKGGHSEMVSLKWPESVGVSGPSTARHSIRSRRPLSLPAH